MPQIGLWKLPSTKLFLDFSRHYAKSLTHNFVQGKVIDIQKSDSLFRIDVNRSNEIYSISSKSIILATGAIGRPVIPKMLTGLSSSSSRIFHWQKLDKVMPILKSKLGNAEKRILVLGGGLTAVQTAHKFVQKGNKVILCSRRPLVERHFDIPVKWFDFRESHYYQSQFYHEPVEDRLKALSLTRGGGTVPPVYMKMTKNMEKTGKLIRFVGNVRVVEENQYDKSLKMQLVSSDATVIREETFDAAVLACGLRPDCLVNPLVQAIHKQWPVEMIGGFPNIGEDLRWTENFYVVGGLASLSVGPDASNIMGISRAAETVSNNLDSKVWLREEESNVLRNPFDVFLDETDSETESDDED
mmetsp:Transcript_14707/g.21003  ORF Transcript_14707/g.21003 Transcript_14707/m.21003 type:complete len:357 (-) Transcript_14707:33-1103(-)